VGLPPARHRPAAVGGYCFASETAALTTIGAEPLREVLPGEIVTVDEYGLHSLQGLPPRQTALCTFEHIYFSRPDSVWGGQVIHQIHQRLGRELAREAPVAADLVVPVPDSSTPAGIGYAQESGLPGHEGLIKNRYIGRTFIQPSDELRRHNVALKYNALSDVLEGRRIVVVDDSIVRGNTWPARAHAAQRGVGAHARDLPAHSPPLLRSRHGDARRADRQPHDRRADPPVHRRRQPALSLARGHDARDRARGRLLQRLLTGRYPIELETDGDKQAFEGVFGSVSSARRPAGPAAAGRAAAGGAAGGGGAAAGPPPGHSPPGASTCESSSRVLAAASTPSPALARSPQVTWLWVAPGNGGTQPPGPSSSSTASPR
jgi:hypothetical protein